MSYTLDVTRSIRLEKENKYRKIRCVDSTLQSPSLHDQKMSQSKKQLLDSLEKHKVNTITELRRIERILAQVASHDVTGPMTRAWLHYVDSNNLLSELRGLTRNYPFSSECLDVAKWLVINDPASSRSWNYCWLVLVKIRETYVAFSLGNLPGICLTTY